MCSALKPPPDANCESRVTAARAWQLHRGGAPLGQVFSFLSGLYFRGKLAYAAAFASPPAGAPASLVITAGRGLVPPDTLVTLDDLRELASVPIDAAESRYREPLERDARRLAEQAGGGGHVVLLGSIATPKYCEPLASIFNQRLLFPAAFVGRGDMSRGGLMLRSASAGLELDYIPALGAPRHGTRPARLPRNPRSPAPRGPLLISANSS
ncbi:MAG: hypothetical protein HYS04_01630 [Acidobacteria bacterium]|nr:hypothetical protein [Acidobacteriota bacterium]